MTLGAKRFLVTLGAVAGCASAPLPEHPAANGPPAVYVMQLPEAERDELISTLQDGLIVMSMQGQPGAPRFLHGCKPLLGYVYRAEATRAETERIDDLRDFEARLPRSPAPFRDAFIRGGEITVAMDVVGRYEAGRSIRDEDPFEGDCAGATHYVSGVAMGAFEVTAPASPRAAVGSNRASMSLLRGGARAACSSLALDGPPRGCGAPLRLELRPLPHKPCPPNSILRGDACRSDAEGVAPVGRLPFQVGSDGASPPGLLPVQVETFVRPKERDVKGLCWDGRYADWELGEVEYAVTVDPGGPVLRPRGESLLTGAAAQLTRAGARTSSAELARCVERAVDRWTFPRANTPTWMVLNFRFER